MNNNIVLRQNEDDSIKKDAAADIEEKEGLTKNNEKDIT